MGGEKDMGSAVRRSFSMAEARLLRGFLASSSLCFGSISMVLESRKCSYDVEEGILGGLLSSSHKERKKKKTKLLWFFQRNSTFREKKKEKK